MRFGRRIYSWSFCLWIGKSVPSGLRPTDFGQGSRHYQEFAYQVEPPLSRSVHQTYDRQGSPRVGIRKWLWFFQPRLDRLGIFKICNAVLVLGGAGPMEIPSVVELTCPEDGLRQTDGDYRGGFLRSKNLFVLLFYVPDHRTWADNDLFLIAYFPWDSPGRFADLAVEQVRLGFLRGSGCNRAGRYLRNRQPHRPPSHRV